MDEPDRPILPALLRGIRLRCPECGDGPMLRAYLKVRDRCPTCGEDLSHAAADDGPAFLTILLVGHIMAPILLWYYPAFTPSPMHLFTVFGIGTVVLSLFLLPRMKGIIVAVQWSRRLGGFG